MDSRKLLLVIECLLLLMETKDIITREKLWELTQILAEEAVAEQNKLYENFASWEDLVGTDTED